MKKFFLPLFVFACLFSTQAQTLTDVQTTLISKRTADWCPYCGTYGWQFTKELNTALVGKDAIFWNVHYSGGLATPTAQAIAQNLGGSGQPLFFINTDSDDLGVTGNNIAAKVEEVVGTVEILSTIPGPVSMGAEASVKNNKLNVNAIVKFKDSADAGEYYMGIYLVKKNLVAFQQSVGQNAVHHSVLDHALTPTPFGIKLAAAPILTGTEFTASSVEEDLVLHNGKLEDTRIVVVLWNKVSSGNYIFLNAREIAIVKDETSFTADVNEDALDFICAMGHNAIDVFVKSGSSEDISAKLYDINGREIPSKLNIVSQSQLRLEEVNTPAGLYFVRMNNGKEIKSKQVIILK